MATNIELTTKIDAADSAKTLGDLKKSLKDLISLQSQVGAGSAEFKKLAKAINDTEGKIGDLNDSFNTLKGSGVERLNSSLGLLKEGFASADPGKISLAFDGLKAAMSAVPIFLLIEGFKLLVDNWDDVVSVGKELFGTLSDDEKAIKELAKESEHQKKVTAELSREIEREVKLLGASEASTQAVIAKKKELIQQKIREAAIDAKLQIAKLNEIKNNDDLLEGQLRLQAQVQRKLGFDKEAEKSEQQIAMLKASRGKEQFEAAKNAIETIKDLQTDLVVNEKELRDANEKDAKDARDLRLQNIFEDRQRELALLKAKYDDDRDQFKNNAAALTQLQIKYRNDVNDVNLKYDQIETAQRKEALKKEEDLRAQALKGFHDQIKQQTEARAKENDEIIISTQTQQETLSSIKELYAQKEQQRLKAEHDELLQRQLQETNAYVGVNQQMFTSLQGLSDTFFAIKSANTKKGSAEELAAAKKQFKINKGLQIAQTIMSGTTGVVNALGAKSILPEPFATIAKIANVAAIVTTTAASVAKISSQQFNDSGAGGGAGGGGTSAGAGAAAPPVPQSSAFNPNTVGNVGGVGASGNNNTNKTAAPIQKVIVLESDITKTQNKVAVIQSQATF